MFQSQRRFFGGSNIVQVAADFIQFAVSIAEAILWGEQLNSLSEQAGWDMFQSQRRFFGGSNTEPIFAEETITSFNRRGDSLGGATKNRATWKCALWIVSIAEAILWGEQQGLKRCPTCNTWSFNRRGDSLGGATINEVIEVCQRVVSIAEAILWGEQPSMKIAMLLIL